MTTGEPLPPSPAAPEGARCAEHPLQAAVRICARCGNYMCTSCALEPGPAGAAPQQRTHCRACSPRFGLQAFPFTRDNWTIDGICNYALTMWKQQWLLLGAVAGLGLVATYAFSFAMMLLQAFIMPNPEAPTTEMPIVFFVVMGAAYLFQMVVQFWMQIAMQAVTIGLIRTGRVDLALALNSVRRVPMAFVQMLAVYVPMVVLVGGGLGVAYLLKLDIDDFMMPLLWTTPVLGALMFYLFTGLLFMQLPLLEDPPVGPVRAIEISMRASSGERPRIFVMMLIMGAAMLAGFLACCVGVIFAMGLASLLHASLYLALTSSRDATASNYMPAS